LKRRRRRRCRAAARNRPTRPIPAIEPMPIPPLAEIPLVLLATTGALLVIYRYA
jgi:hypothetical protein